MLACGLIMLPLMGHAQDCRKKSNDVIETIMARRSIRNYLNKPVEHEKLAIVAKCGVENQDFIKETTEIFKKEMPEQAKRDANFKNMYRNAPNIIVVATPKGDSWGLLNAGLLGENMMIAAKALGLGTCCLGSAARFLQDSEACKPYLAKLNLPKDYEICYVLAIGYPDEAPEARPRDESKIEYIK